jgi:hypothetical protein
VVMTRLSTTTLHRLRLRFLLRLVASVPCSRELAQEDAGLGIAESPRPEPQPPPITFGATDRRGLHAPQALEKCLNSASERKCMLATLGVRSALVKNCARERSAIRGTEGAERHDPPVWSVTLSSGPGQMPR